MAKSKQVPTLEVPNLDKFHFGNIDWRFSKQHHLFHINRLEDAIGKLSFPIPPHRKTVYDLLFLTAGESVRYKGLNKYRFKENEFFFLPAFQITSHESLSQDARGFFMHFSSDIFADGPQMLRSFSFLQFNTSPVVAVPGNRLTPIINIFDRLLDLYHDDMEKEYDLVVWYMMALFSEVSRYVAAPENESYDSAAMITQQFKNVLTQHIYSYRTVKDFAKLLHITPNHLNKCVKRTLNKTAQSLLNEMLILEAKSLLKYSNLTISQIAYSLCKSSPSNFSRFFKNETGMTPSDYLTG